MQVGKTTAVQQVPEGITMPFHHAVADLPATPPKEFLGNPIIERFR